MNFFIDQIIIFSIALLIDLSIGDPPEKIDRYYPHCMDKPIDVFL